MSRDDHQTTASLARQEVHVSYLRRDSQTQAGRLTAIERQMRDHSTLLHGLREHQDRLRRVEMAVSLLKAAGGMLMLVVAQSGLVSGKGAQLLEKAGGAMLGGS
jgi:hypothetical protein